MKKLLVFQHVPHELLGTLNPMLKKAGFRIRYVNFGRHPDAQPRLDGYDGLVVLGGPMSVNDEDRLPHLVTEMKLIEAALSRNLPVMGICLGAQLIAKTLGAAVYPEPGKGNRLVRCFADGPCAKRSAVGRVLSNRENFSVARRDFRHSEKHQPSRFLFPVRQSSFSLRRLMSTAFSFIWKSTNR